MENPNKNCLEGMQCPECGSFGPFKVFVTKSGFVSIDDDGHDDVEGDTEWGDDSPCECENCQFSGLVTDFMQSEAEQPEMEGNLRRGDAKAICLSVAIIPSNPDITVDDVMKALRQYGQVTSVFEGEVDTVSFEGLPPLPNAVWIHASADEQEPYEAVAKAGEFGGRQLAKEEVEQYRRDGVCVEMLLEHARADRYGTPLAASSDDFAAATVGDHGFRVLMKGFQVHTTDRGDDGCEQLWMKIALP